jgi:hypothetical protein
MSVTPLPQTQAALSRMLFNGQASYDNAASLLNSTFGNSGSGAAASIAEGAANITLNVVEVEPNNTRLGSQFVNLGTAPGKSDIVNISGSVTTIGEEDYYSFDLRKGDILDVRLNAIAGGFTIVQLADINGRELLVATGPNNLAVIPGTPTAPQSTSPRFSDGLVNLTYVIDTTGRYAIRIGDQIGPYTLNLRTFRPVAEQQPAGTAQTLLLDFDPGFVQTSQINLFGLAATIPPVVRVPKLGTLLPQIGLTAADENRVIDAITDRVRQKVDHAIGVNGKNGYFPTSGNPGEFGIFVTTTRDNPQLRGQPNVTKVMIGGTQANFGLPATFGLLGIAQSVDIGNFDLQENALVMLDIILADAALLPKSGTSTTLDVFAELTAVVVAHEAGHTYGGIHQDPFNTVLGIMDQFYSGPVTSGAGVDGIFGTADDMPLQFVDDEFSPTLGMFFGGGVSNTAPVLGFGLSTSNQSGFVSGTVFNDRNRDGNRGSGEEGLTERFVFADYNNNGILDFNESRTGTDSSGNYRLPIRPGTWTVRSIAPTNWNLTGSVARTVTVGLNQTASNINFGQILPNQAVTGFKWADTNGNGIRDAGENGIGGFWIYVDLDGDDRIDIGEPAAITAADGSFSLNPPSNGTYAIREVVPPGFIQTFPVGGEHIVTFTGTPLRGIDFLNQPARDYGDAPSPYPTLIAQNGASHGFDSNLVLGTNVDFESNGSPNTTATGDDIVGRFDTNSVVIDDEDGVVFARPIVANDTQNLARVTVRNATGSIAYLSGWIDFNRDGDWSDAGEKILSDVQVASGRVDHRFTAPAGALLGNTYARFRLSQTPGLSVTGAADNGEVEDYLVNVTDREKYAIDDTFNSIPRNSTANILDVQANDFMRTVPGESASITRVTQGSLGGSVVVSGNVILYTPRNGFVGTETFTYTVLTSTGKEDTAKVTVTTETRRVDPFAVDDSYDLPSNSVDLPLNVLANDLEGTTGPLIIDSFTTPDQGGRVEFGQGNLSLRYTPRTGFGGTESFRYTVRDGAGKVSTANVTVHTVEGSRADDKVEISLSFTDLLGNAIPAVRQGDKFQLHVAVSDLRATADIPSPGRAGVFAAYLDLLYNSDLVSTIPGTVGGNFDFDVTFVSPYNQGLRGSNANEGIISQLGGATSNTNGISQPPPVRMATITLEARSAGIAEFATDPADPSPTTDVLLFSEDTAVPKERVRYRRASIEIVPNSVEFPFAVDDSLPTPLGLNSAFNPIDVLRNDRTGNSPPVTLVRVSQPLNGETFIDNNGTVSNTSDDKILYTPRVGFQGTDQFTYTIRDTRGFESTAEVTVQVGNSRADDIVQFRLEATNLSGQPIDQATVGQKFLLRGYVQQLQTLNGGQLQGVFAAYQDILYNPSLATISPLSFNSVFDNPARGTGEYPNAPSGDLNIPGLINELGSVSREVPASIVFPGAAEKLQFVLEVTANAAGVLTFVNDPADISPFHDSLVFDPTTVLQPNQIRFVGDSITIGNLAAGEGFTNAGNRFDVNNDGFISPIDALVVINSLGRGGSRPLLPSGAEGEAGARMFIDVNGDGFISPIDVLQVINAMNQRRSGSAEGEGSAVLESVSDDSPLDIDSAIDILADDIASWRRRR